MNYKIHHLKAPRLTREQTHLRILNKADELFRQYGFGKTTVADIASELEMSSANIYKFFPSKEAIVQACAERNFSTIKNTVTKVVQSSSDSLTRLEEVVVSVFRFHKELFRNERQIFKLVLNAIDQDWKCIQLYNEFMLKTVTQLVEEGVEKKEFRPDSPKETAQILLDCLSLALHPHLRHRYNHDESEERVRAQVRFLGRALV